MEIRKQITELLRTRDIDAIGELPGIDVIRKRDEVPGDCSCYVFHTVFKLEIANMWEAYLHVVHSWKRVIAPQTGDLVVYYRRRKAMHFGIFREDGRIESKFGYAHVYAHNVFDVPDHYGNEISFYRPKGRKS